MKRIGLIIWLTGLVFVISFAQRPMYLSANFTGEKMWNTQQMVPYSNAVSLEIIDSIAYLNHKSSERVDTFYYKRKHNDAHLYVRKNKFNYENLSLSKDTLNLQVGEPQEQNFFYKLSSINTFVICAECHGTGKDLCYRCRGTGNVPPRQKGGPDEAVGICPVCHGSGTRSNFPCSRCNGFGKITRITSVKK